MLGAGCRQASPPRRVRVPEGDSEIARLLGHVDVLLWVSCGCRGHHREEQGRGGSWRSPCLAVLRCPHEPRGSACLSDEVCGGPGGDWGGSSQGPAPGRDGTWNRPAAARLPIGACHSCPRAGGQRTLEGHHAIMTDGHGGAARSLRPAAIVYVVSPAPRRRCPSRDQMPSVS